jgi:hypothetical protein
MGDIPDKELPWILRVFMVLSMLIAFAIMPTVIFSSMRSSYAMTLAQHDIFQDHPGLDIHVTRLNLTFMQEANSTLFHCKGSAHLDIQSQCL